MTTINNQLRDQLLKRDIIRLNTDFLSTINNSECKKCGHVMWLSALLKTIMEKK